MTESEGTEVLLRIIEHCLEKKKWKSLTFSLKSVLKRFLQNSWGIIGIFFLFEKIFNRDQYTF